MRVSGIPGVVEESGAGALRVLDGPAGDGPLAVLFHWRVELRVERHWREARLTTIFEGTSEIQMKIVADRLLPRSPLG